MEDLPSGLGDRGRYPAQVWQMKRREQFSIASFFVLTTVFALLLTLFRLLRSYSPATYFALWVLSLVLSLIGATMVLAALTAYWEHKFSPGPTNGTGRDVVGIMFIGSCFLIPVLAYCFDVYALEG